MENGGDLKTESKSRLRKIIIDTDGGVDDALAILLALSSPKELEIVAITTVAGNVKVEQATENVLRTLEVYESACKAERLSFTAPPVFQGLSQPLVRPLCTATHVHGDDGLGGCSKILFDKRPRYPTPSLECDFSKSAPLAILDLVSISKEKALSIVTIGPLTNIAVAARMDPNRFRLLKEIVIMGGAFDHLGNVTPCAEYNIFVDPEALRVVLESGVPIVIVPLDVTEQVWLDWDVIQAHVSKESILARFVYDICSSLSVFLKNIGLSSNAGLHMHDPLAISIAMDQASVGIVPEDAFLSIHVDVECRGEFTSGKTIADLVAARTKRSVNALPPNASLCMKVNANRFLDIFLQRVLSR